MGKGRRRNYSQKELDQLQTLKRENDKLKKQVSSLRKQLARIDLDRYTHIKDLVDKQLAEDAELTVTETSQQMLDRMRVEWSCETCKDGYLEINIYTRFDELWYYRECNCCEKRTVSQKYHKDVKGIIKKKEEHVDEKKSRN